MLVLGYLHGREKLRAGGATRGLYLNPTNRPNPVCNRLHLSSRRQIVTHANDDIPPPATIFPQDIRPRPSSRKPFSQYPRTHLTSGSNPQKSTNSRIPAATETPPGRGVSRGVSSPQRRQPNLAAISTRHPAKSPSFKDLPVEGRRLITPCRSSTSAAFYAEPLAAAASHSVPQ
jgi:hypothetical protein